MMAINNQTISLDIWDTILRRTCHPDEIKLYTAQRMLFLLGPYLLNPDTTTMAMLDIRRNIEYQIGLRAQEEGFDDEYEIEEVLDTCIVEATGDSIDKSIRRQIRDDIVNSEIEQEIHTTYLDKDLIKFLCTLEFQNIIIISDFYMSQKKIVQLLNAKEFPFPITHYFLSCDSKLNKRSGRLFSHVSSNLKVAPNSILHIGDNEHSDIFMAKKCGFRAHHFSGTAEHFTRLEKERFFLSRNKHTDKSNKLLLTKLAARSTRHERKNKIDRLFNYGKNLSPLFTGFSLYIQDLCFRRQHQQVHFFTREGKFFKEVFDRVLQQNPYNLTPITSYLLPVSRLATFFPSLRAISCQELMRLWSQYSSQSMNALFQSLYLSPTDYIFFLNKYQISPTISIQEPWHDKRIIKLFNDINFIKQITTTQRERRTLLKDHFESLKFGSNNKALIVDIGWRGSIQDNIAHIYPNVQIDGVYLGLQKFLNNQPSNTKKFGYIADRNYDEEITHSLLLHVRPFEMLCNVTGGSACGYTKTQGGASEPIYQYDGDEDIVHTNWIAHFQAGVTAGIEQSCRLIKQHGISLKELQNISKTLAEQLLLDPPIEICQAYFALNHNETFGVGKFIRPENDFRLRNMLLGYISSDKRRNFLASLEQSGWPQGLLRYRYGGVLSHIKKLRNKLLRR
jgi:FMN phosphatase YigB (HAD superfamily)